MWARRGHNADLVVLTDYRVVDPASAGDSTPRAPLLLVRVRDGTGPVGPISDKGTWGQDGLAANAHLVMRRVF